MIAMDEITIDLNEKLEKLRKTKFNKSTYTIKKAPSKYMYRDIFGPGDGLPWTVDILQLTSDEYVEAYKQYKRV